MLQVFDIFFLCVLRGLRHLLGNIWYFIVAKIVSPAER